ncbi:MAG: SDR family oxidoreductase [Thermodesulfobacteriota bacterium]|nr:SDR family oxidoreductase [Thermodesulfobacteriota bacterium]
MKIHNNSRVMITGAASGIGRSTALAMAGNGARLFLTDINESGLDETCGLVRQAGGTIGHHQAFDITDRAAVNAFADDIHRDFGPMDVLVNNAGIALFALVEDMAHDHWEKVLNVNLRGPIHVIESFLPAMIQAKKGHVVNISSTAGLAGLPWHAAYSTTKWGLRGLSEVLRYDLMQHNIGVSVICPGGVDTPLKNRVEILTVDRGSKAVQELIARFEKHAVTPEHVAQLIINAVEKKKFLVITSTDIKALYFLKRFCRPVYHLIMQRLSVMMNRLKTGT